MKKYGFIYLWYDKKHKKFYLGRHWGTEDDGYICSSTNMRNNYNNRPSDFKRRIVSLIYDKESLINEEQRWLDMIQKEELRTRYYNISKKATAPSTLGYSHSDETIKRIKESNRGKIRSEKTRKKISHSLRGIPCSEEKKQKLRNNKLSDERKKQISENLRGREVSSETRKKISESNRGKVITEETRKKMSESKKGIKHSEEWKQQMSLRVKGNKYGAVPRSQKFKDNASYKMKEYWKRIREKNNATTHV